MEPDHPLGGVTGVESVLSDTLPTQPHLAEAVDHGKLTLPFGVFYRDRRDRVARALALTLGDAGLASEAVDEAMARAFQRWDRVGTYTDPAGWVYRVGLNWATSVRRRLWRAPVPPTERDPDDIGPLSEPDLMAALLELPLHQRAVVVCRFYLGFSEAETSAALRTKPGTVKSRLHRALRHLEVRVAHLSPKEHR